MLDFVQGNVTRGYFWAQTDPCCLVSSAVSSFCRGIVRKSTLLWPLILEDREAVQKMMSYFLAIFVFYFFHKFRGKNHIRLHGREVNDAWHETVTGIREGSYHWKKHDKAVAIQLLPYLDINSVENKRLTALYLTVFIVMCLVSDIRHWPSSCPNVSSCTSCKSRNFQSASLLWHYDFLPWLL